MASSQKQYSHAKIDARIRVPGEEETFGARVAAAIDARGWTLAETAREVSRHLPAGETFNPVNLSHYVHGRSFPRPKYREALAKALDLPDVALHRHARKGANGSMSNASHPAHERSQLRVQDLGDGTARVQFDQVMPWDDALKLLQTLKHTDG